MPFTPSHAVVALPFLRTPLIPSAIAIGAMTPDLPLFVRGVGLSYGFTHTLTNIVWIGLIAAGLFLIWRVVLRPAVGELSPRWMSTRLPDGWEQSPAAAARQAIGAGESRAYPLRLAASLLIGVVSHIVWDLFTHEGRWGVEVVPALAEQWGPLQGYKWLQHGSSVIGLIVIAAWSVRWIVRRTPSGSGARLLPAGVRVSWWLSLPAALLVGWCIGLGLHGPLTAEFTAQHLAYRALPPACAVWGLLTIGLCLVIGVRRAGRR